MLRDFLFFACFNLLLLCSVGWHCWAFQPSLFSGTSFRFLPSTRAFAGTKTNSPASHRSFLWQSTLLASKSGVVEEVDEIVISSFSAWCQACGKDGSNNDRFEIFAQNYRHTQDALKGAGALIDRANLSPYADCSWEEYMAIVEQDRDYLSQMTVKDLKEECKRLNLKVSGTKAVLVEKLQYALRTIAAPGESAIVIDKADASPTPLTRTEPEPEKVEAEAQPEPDVDLSIPYDAAAKLAHEASDKSVSYDAFKAKYEADAVADVMAKYVDLSISSDAEESMPVVAETKISMEDSTPKVEQELIKANDQPQNDLAEEIGSFAGSLLVGLIGNINEMREKEKIAAEERRAKEKAAAEREFIRRKQEAEEFRAKKEKELKEAEALREKEQKARRAEQEAKMRQIQESFEADAVARAEKDLADAIEFAKRDMAKVESSPTPASNDVSTPNPQPRITMTPTPPSKPPVEEKKDIESKDDKTSVGQVSGIPMDDVMKIFFPGKKN
mmetsp:Transcript_19384/g.28424  ORF Transcript_19384/g.28424 Transcript_19384/m.28424 type:complete len:500 (+) Transcript_19384:101-1600(+)